MISQKGFTFSLLMAATLLVAARSTSAQETTVDTILAAETFIQPAPEIAEAVMAPRHLNRTPRNPSPDGRFFIDERNIK